MASDSRLQQINEVNKTIENCEKDLNSFLELLNWSKEKLPKKKTQQNVESNTYNSVTKPVSGTGQKLDATDSTSSLLDEERLKEYECITMLSTTIDKNKALLSNYTDLNKLKRDLRRRRVKHRTTKTAPLTYTEEIRELINLQMEMERQK